MSFEAIAAIFLLLIAFGMVGLTYWGHHVAARRRAREALGGAAGATAIEGAVFALMTLLVAFTFSGAATRFAARRQLILEEANAIATAYLRLDLLPPAAQPRLREDFRRYVDSRLAVYRTLPDLEASARELARSNALQRQLWRNSMAALERTPDARASLLLVPSLNQMIDLTSARAVALRTHPSPVIFALLGSLALACAFVAGLGMGMSATPSRLHVYGFSALVVLTLAVILDFEFPRLGLIRIDHLDALLVEVRANMR